MLDESKKTFLTFILSSIAIVLLIYFSFFSPSSIPVGEHSCIFVETPVNQSTFLHQLADAKHVYIIMDLRNISDDEIRRNIMQCGVDLAGSQALASKNISIASLTDTECHFSSSLDNPQKKSIPFCLCARANPETVTFYITNSDKTDFFNNEIKIGIGKIYKIGSCHVDIAR